MNRYKKVTGAKSFNSGGNPHRYVEEVLGARKIEALGNMTAEAFCKKHPHGRYILDMEAHWSGCVEGCIYDAWDCSRNPVNFAYEITTEGYEMPDLRQQVFKYCCTAEQISDAEARIRIYDGNGSFVERIIPKDLVQGYVLCLEHSNYRYIDLDAVKKEG